MKRKQKQATRNYDDDIQHMSAEMSRSLIVGEREAFYN